MSDLDLSQGHHPAKGEKDSAHGLEYHRKVLMFMLLKLRSTSYEFVFSLENSDAEKFDDFYMEILKKKACGNIEKHYVYMQIKHRDETKLIPIKYDELFGTGSKFDLKEYFLSFCKIRKRIFDRVNSSIHNVELDNFDKYANFFLFTNQKLDFISPSELINPNNKTEAISFVDSSQTSVLKTEFAFGNGHFQIKFNSSLATQFKTNIGNMITNKKDLRMQKKHDEILRLASVSGLGKSLDEMIELFIGKLFFSVEQYSESDLMEELRNQFRNQHKLHKPDTIIDIYSCDVSKWITKVNAKWYGKSDLNKFFEKLEFEIERMSLFGVDHYEHLCMSQHITFDYDFPLEDFVNSQKCLLHIQTSSVFLSSLKMAQSLEKHDTYGSRGYFAFMENSKITTKIVNSFRSLDGIRLMILECQGAIIHNDLVNELLDISISQQKKTKKVILICSKTAAWFHYKYKNPHFYEKIQDDPDFKALSFESKEKILRKEVFFQNETAAVYKILLGSQQNCSDIDISQSISNKLQGLNLSSEALTCLLDEKTAKIKRCKGIISDMSSDYSEFNKIIDENIIKKVFLNQIEGNSILVIDGERISSIDALIDILKISDHEEKQLVETSMEIKNISEVTNAFNKNIILFKDDIGEDEFKNICRHNENKTIFWLHYSKNNENSKWIWKMIYEPIVFARTVKRIPVKSTLKKKLLDVEFTDCFVIKGSSNDVRRILNIEHIRKLTDSLKIVEDGLQATPEFEIFSRTSKNVHKFEIIKNDIVWKESIVNGHLSSSESKPFDLIEDEKISVVVDDPGMGKSTLLTQLAEAKFKDTWIIRLNLKECENELKNIEKYSGLDQVTFNEVFIKFLMKFGLESSCPLTRDCLSYILSSGENLRELLILMDAYDEISEHSRQSVDAMIKLFKQSHKRTNSRLVITSRHHPNIEENLEQLFVIQIEGFDAVTRENYLKKYFESRNSLLKTKENAAQFDQKIADVVKQLLNSVEKIFNDESKKIITVPLKTRLISEAYEDEVYRCITNNSEINISDITIQGLYERIIEGKINIYLYEKIRIDLTGDDEDANWSRELHEKGIRKLLWKSAIETICHEEDCSQIFQGIDFKKGDKIRKEIPVRVGIALRILSDCTYKFIHLTFAEYLSADFIIRSIREGLTFEIAEFLLKTILMKKDYINVRFFMNEILKKDPIFNNNLKILELIVNQEFTKNNSNTILTILYRTCSENNPNILKLLSSVIDFKSEMIRKYFLDGEKEDIAKGILNGREEWYDWDLTSPLHYASANGHNLIVEFLVEKGADIEAKSRYKNTSLHYASANGHQSIAEFLVERGAYMEATNEDKRTPLHFASIEGFKSIVKFLVERGANIEAENNNKKTPLHFASERGYHSIVEFLVKRGANTEAEDDDKMAPLHYASWNGHHSIVELLVKQGVNIEAENIYKKTPLHYARENGHQSIFDFLQIASPDT